MSARGDHAMLSYSCGKALVHGTSILLLNIRCHQLLYTSVCAVSQQVCVLYGVLQAIGQHIMLGHYAEKM